jgi:peptidoglycan/LPS O-acetylase OafA/YrhL
MGKRVYGLDILRAFAILSVIYSHSFFLIIDHVNEAAYNLFSFDGVTLFFVLSGFLIGGILLRTINETEFKVHDLVNFWIRRWFRTLPNYFFMLLLLIAIASLKGSQLPGNLASYFLFLQNFSSPHPSFFPEAWSLSVEEWFYLIVPAGLLVTQRIVGKNKKYLVLNWSLGIILFVSALRIYRAMKYGYHDFEAWDLNQRKLVITRLDSIMYGLFAAWIRYYNPNSWLRWKKQLLILGMLLLAIPNLFEFMLEKNMIYLNYFSMTVTSLGTFFLLPALSELKQGKGILYRFLTFVSLVSYSMYLVNFSLVQLGIIPSLTKWIVMLTTDHLTISIIRYLIYWSFTFVLSYLLYSYYERPMMLLREKLSFQAVKSK